MIKLLVSAAQVFLIAFLVNTLWVYAKNAFAKREQEEINEKLSEIERAEQEAARIEEIDLKKFKENKKKLKDFKES